MGPNEPFGLTSWLLHHFIEVYEFVFTSVIVILMLSINGLITYLFTSLLNLPSGRVFNSSYCVDCAANVSALLKCTGYVLVWSWTDIRQWVTDKHQMQKAFFFLLHWAIRHSLLKNLLQKATISMKPRRITAAFVLPPYLSPSMNPAPTATMFYRNITEAHIYQRVYIVRGHSIV